MESIAGISNFFKTAGIDELRFLLTGIGLSLLIAYIFYENLLVSILFLPAVILYIRKCVRDKEQKRKLGLTMQFKDALTSISFAINVGYSIENAFREGYKEMHKLYGADAYITEELRVILLKVENNENLEDLLDDFARRSDVEDIRYFSEIFRYAKRSGGDLAAIIKNTSRTIREKVEVMQDIQVLISGKKMEEKIMCFLPMGIVLYLKVTSPGFLSSLYGNLTGVLIMTVCLAVYMAAVVLGIRIMDIKV